MVRAVANREVKRDQCGSQAIYCLTLCRVGLPGRLAADNNDPGLFYDTACICVDPIKYDDRSTQQLIRSHADHMGAIPIHCLIADHWIF